MTETEREYLDRVCGPGFSRFIDRYRSDGQRVIQEWTTDVLRSVVLEFHDSGCDCLLHGYPAWVGSKGLAEMIRVIIDEEAMKGVDTIELMQTVTVADFAKRAVRDSRLIEHLESADAMWNQRQADLEARMNRLASGREEGQFAL